MAHDIFVSYSSEDKVVADAVVTACETSGLRCWVAPRDIKPGTDWGDAICSAIDASKIVLLIFSGNSNRSKRVLDEIYYAISEEKILLPFRIENLDPTGAMRLHLSSRHWLDAFQPSWRQHIDQLVTSAADILGRAPLVPAIIPPILPPILPAEQAKAPAPKIKPVKEKAKKKPWLWIGLGVTLAAVLIWAGYGWFSSQKALAGRQPTSQPALAMNSTATPTQVPDNTSTPTTTKTTIVVTSAEDFGTGSLRQALLDAQTGDTILFDPTVFPPMQPSTIAIKSALPVINQGVLTLDASNAGVILDGSQASGEFTPGIEINSERNIIKGLQVVHFSGPGIIIGGSANFNRIGGDRSKGTGPLGEGNLFSDNSDGMFLNGSDNVIAGNLIGTDGSGSGKMGNRSPGIALDDIANRNVIGPDNIIAYNGTDYGCGVEIRNLRVQSNTITANSIHENSGPGVCYNINDAAPYTYSTPPLILYFDLEAGTAYGQACKACMVEIFSTGTQDGEIYEGKVTTDDLGNFAFSKGQALSGPFLTGTARVPEDNTSEFSAATPARSDIQIALEAIQNQAPLYQTGFDSWDFGDLGESARIEAGKLVVTSDYEHVGVSLQNQASDRFAIEFELRILESSQDGHCIFYTNNQGVGGFRTIANGFFYSSGNSSLDLSKLEGSGKDFATAKFDPSKSNTIVLIVLGDQIGAFLNGQPAYSVLAPGMASMYSDAIFAASYSIVCEYDNYKFWDLSGTEFNPGTG